MANLTAREACRRLGALIEELAASHEPVHIIGKRANAVLVSEEDWRSIQETLHLLSIPGMRKSVCNGFRTPVRRCHKEPGW
ncbi:MAG: type II toxin-antitoxin system Phd/YefM family antitoxin [Phycisphaerae bacterium]